MVIVVFFSGNKFINYFNISLKNPKPKLRFKNKETLPKGYLFRSLTFVEAPIFCSSDNQQR